MDMEALDRLLMDRALGALPADTDALLEAYLAYDQAAAGRAREFTAAAAAARRILQQPPATLPPFPGRSILSVEQAQRRVRALRAVAGMAAVLVVGIGLGLVFPRGRVGEERTRTITLAPATPVVAAHEPEEGFWSTERLYESARRGPRPATTHVIWESTSVMPKLGEQL